MSFNPNVPQSTDDLSDSQGDLLQNNLALDASFSRNHTAFSDLTASNGKHKFVEILNSAGIPAPAPGLAVNSGTVYTNTVGTPSESQAFYTPDATGSAFQLTTALSASVAQFGVMLPYPAPPIAPVLLRNGGWTFLPGGLIIQYGHYQNINLPIFTSGSTTVLFPIAFPNACYLVLPIWDFSAAPSSDATLGIRSFTTTTFLFAFEKSSSTTETQGIYWVAIGN
jgi:hypothetical protein